MKVQGIEFDDAFGAAGFEYVNQLARLGMDISFAALAVDKLTSAPRLIIVTRLVDFFGSTKLYALLYKAYQLSKLPREVNPFDVEIFSDNSALGQFVNRELTGRPAPMPIKMQAIREDTGEPVAWDLDLPASEVGDFLIAPPLIYRNLIRTPKAAEVKRISEKFERNFDKLLAA